jgi:hypothetical protein
VLSARQELYFQLFFLGPLNTVNVLSSEVNVSAPRKKPNCSDFDLRFGTGQGSLGHEQPGELKAGLKSEFHQAPVVCGPIV